MQPNFENPAEAARAWASEYEARIAAEKERDKAKTERGQISSRREATALATIMLANRQIKQLNEKLVHAPIVAETPIETGVSSYKNTSKTPIGPASKVANSLAIQYATVQQVTDALNDTVGFDWHQLRQWCNKYKQPPRLDGAEGYAWPASAWKAVFGVDILALREDGVLV